MTEIQWTDAAREAVAQQFRAWGVRSRHGDWTDAETQARAAHDALDALAPHVAAREAQAAAKAWDEGKATGFSRAMRFMSDEPDVDINPPNPYRIERGES